MNSTNPQIGLVLSGGGAKGAYQVGALSYLAELGIQPTIIAGTSIGALNGAVLASYSSFSQGVFHLNRLWEQLGKTELLRPHGATVLKTIYQTAKIFIPLLRESLIAFLINKGLLKDQKSIFDTQPLEELIYQNLDPVKLRQGIELWVTVFPSLGIPGLDYDFLINLLLAKTGTDAHWLRAQDIADEIQLYNLLLASVAIPLAFPSRQVHGQSYIDGGIADNVPLKALAARGITHAIVIHLQNGATWNRYDFPNQTILEIRPELPINKSELPIIGLVDSWFDFSATRITQLKQRGYEDAKRCLEPVLETFDVVLTQRQTHSKMVDSTLDLLNDSPLLF